MRCTSAIKRRTGFQRTNSYSSNKYWINSISCDSINPHCSLESSLLLASKSFFSNEKVEIFLPFPPFLLCMWGLKFKWRKQFSVKHISFAFCPYMNFDSKPLCSFFFWGYGVICVFSLIPNAHNNPVLPLHLLALCSRWKDQIVMDSRCL